MNYLIVIDDATLGVQQQKDFETPGGVSPIAECMFMGQKYKIGVLIASHSASALSPMIRQNVGAWLVTGLPGEDPYLVRTLLAVTPEQSDEIRTSLQLGQFVCLNSILWPLPVRAEYVRPVIPAVFDESMRKALVERFFARVVTKPPAPMAVFRPQPVASKTNQGQATVGKELNQEQVQMLVIIASGLPKTAGKVYEAMGVNRTQGRKIAKGLEAVGAQAAHRFSTGRIGGRICFFEVLDYGWTILVTRGIARPNPLTNGGFEHELAALLLRAEAHRKDFGIQFEVYFDGLRGDAVITNKKTGQRICVNIGISNPDHEVDSIEKFFTLPVSSSVKYVLVARDVAFGKKVRKILKARKVKDTIVKKVHFRVIADLVKE